jgi:hypothetical protein
MPYILNLTTGSRLTSVADGTANNTTGLTFLGKNFAGYGQPFEENFVKLLENFSSPGIGNAATHPTLVNPLQGQLWFNNTNRQLYISYDGNQFKGIGSITVGSTSTVSTPVDGDMFWDDGVLYGYQAGSPNPYVTIGPSNGSQFSSWIYNRVTTVDGITKNSSIVGKIGNLPVVAFSKELSYEPQTPNLIIGNNVNIFSNIKPGITLPNADPTTGVSSVSTTSGYLLWGSAADAINARNVSVTNQLSFSSNYYVPLSNTTTNSVALVTSSDFYYNNGVLNVTASSAYYADLAERYASDTEYEVGTVLIIGGEKEVTVTSMFADTRVAGVVSKNPAYLMNKDAGTDQTHPAIALKGRVPCKVVGHINKGDLLVTSDTPGYACAAMFAANKAGTIIGKALGSQTEGLGFIEILVI